MLSAIPSLVSFSRLLFIPFIAAAVYNNQFTLGLILFAVAAFTDILDGWLAIKLNAVSRLGAFLDPLCDKIFILGTLFILNDAGFLLDYSNMMLYMLLAFEVLLAAAAGTIVFLAKKSSSANSFGKAKMVLETVAISALFVGLVLVADFALFAAMLLAILSLAGRIATLIRETSAGALAIDKNRKIV